MRKDILPALFVAIFALPTTLWADDFPDYTVDAMCDMADVIIEGTYLGKNGVQIDKVYKSSPLLPKEPKRIEVSQLDKHSRTLWRGFRNDDKTLETRSLVLFLVQKKPGEWVSMSTIDGEGQCGSCGLFWFDDSACYGYTQAMNPGPYVLLPPEDAPRRIPKAIRDLRTDIKTGLANFREWQRSLAIENSAEKAWALSRYLLKNTSLKGDKGTYLYAVRKPMAALGKDAVPALIEVLRTTPAGEKLNQAVFILSDIGPLAAPAVPDLITLLGEPDRAYAGSVLYALGSTGDPRAVPNGTSISSGS